MKKIALFSLLIAFLALSFQSCKKSTLGITRVTTYPELEIIGDDFIVLEVGSEFVDEGAFASIGETEVDFEVTGVVDTDQPGFYSINYTAVNPEGFSITKTRTVVVYESGLVSGLYEGIRVNRGIGGPVLIYDNGDGNYFISDLTGGFYEFGLGYGNPYSTPTIINVDEIGKTFTIVDGAYSEGWGEFVTAEDISISDDFSVWEYTHVFISDGFSFDIKLTKVL